MKYLYGCSDIQIDGYETCVGHMENIEDIESLVVISDGSNLNLADSYKFVKEALLREKQVYMISVGGIGKEARQLCMLMVSYNCYNVYSVDDVYDIDDEFMEMIESRKCTIAEVETYVGADIAAYPEMSKMLLKLKEYINAGEVNGILKYVDSNSDKIGAMAGLIDYMKGLIDELSSNMENNSNEVARIARLAEEKENKLTTQLNELKKALQTADVESGVQKKAIADRDAKIEILENEKSIAQSTPQPTSSMSGDKVVMSYTTLNVDIMVGQALSGSGRNPKVTEIIYFKEVRPCKYINSLVVNLLKYLQKSVNAKLLIYDDDCDFNYLYRPLPVINMQLYVNNKNELMAKHDKWVVVEPSRAIIEDVLMDTEVVIIYDRLKRKDDIVAGRKVHKYWVVNSLTDVKNLGKIDGITVDMTKVISYKGLSRACIAINDVKEYKRMTPSGKLSAYINMLNVGDNGERIVDIMAKQCSLLRLLK